MLAGQIVAELIESSSSLHLHHLPSSMPPPFLPSYRTETKDGKDQKIIWETRAIRDLLLCLPLQPLISLLLMFHIERDTAMSS